MQQPDAPLRPNESLFAPLREQPGLLLRELLWRWSCGGMLLAVASYDALRLWQAWAPAVRATGLSRLSGDSLLADPSAALTSLAALYALRPPVERAALGLAPFAIFCWVIAFAVGRAAVLARWDARLPRRPWLLAGIEAARLGLILGVSAVWSFLSDGAARIALRGDSANVLLYALLALAATGGCLWIWLRVGRALQLAAAFALVDRRLGFTPAFAAAWRVQPSQFTSAVQQLRRRASRAGWLLLVLALLASLLPLPGAGWLLYGWWALWTLALLAATDAVRLGQQLALLALARKALATRASAVAPELP